MLAPRLLPIILTVCAALLVLKNSSDATPLFAIQAAERCDTCHEEPDPKDPKWDERNYKWSERKCGLTCSVCHENPSGGMLRTPTGDIYGANVLSLFKNPYDDKIKDYLGAIKENGYFTLGGDLRFLALFKEDADTNPLFFPMQSDIYLNIKPVQHLSLFTQVGLERGGNSAVRETFLLLKDFPYKAYAKAGRFIPPYGLRLDDHTAFIRAKTGLDQSQSSSYYAGYEIGAEPVLVFARLAQFNSDLTPSSDSERTAKGVSAQAGWQGLWLHATISYMGIEDFEASSLGSTDRQMYGISGAIRYKALTYSFELDKLTDDLTYSGSSSSEGAVIAFNEINFKARNGLNLKLRHETFIPDEASGDMDEERYVAGVDLFPYQFTEINFQYRLKKVQDSDDENQFLILAHIWI